MKWTIVYQKGLVQHTLYVTAFSYNIHGMREPELSCKQAEL